MTTYAAIHIDAAECAEHAEQDCCRVSPNSRGCQQNNAGDERQVEATQDHTPPFWSAIFAGGLFRG
jgi:hypothetical protein